MEDSSSLLSSCMSFCSVCVGICGVVSKLCRPVYRHFHPSIISTSLAIMFPCTHTYLLMKNKVISESTVCSKTFKLALFEYWHSALTSTSVILILVVLYVFLNSYWLLFSLVSALSRIDVNPKQQQAHVMLCCCAHQRPVMYYSVNKFATCIEKRPYQTPVFFFLAMSLFSYGVAKLSHCHICLGDAPIMFPFSFRLFFIASNHFYSLPSTFCSTLPGDLAVVSISLLSLFNSLAGR